LTRLLTIKDVRAVLQCSRTYVYGLFNSGELQPIKLGRSTRVSDADVEEFVARRAAVRERRRERRPGREPRRDADP
jgi:excisionase family DNA binding protein